MALTVLNVAFSAATVDAGAVGGAEQILGQLDRALVEAGHQSLVIASAGSKTAGRLLATPGLPRALTPDARHALIRAHREAIAQALAETPVDLVHLHGLDCLDYLPEADVRMLITLHLPPAWYPRELFTVVRPRLYFNCVSHSQLRDCPPTANLLGVIENGVSLDFFQPGRHKTGFAVALGRICPEKGFHLAIDAARLAGMPLLLAGRVFGYTEHDRYFGEQILPRLDERRQFIGAVAGRRKARLLARARCLVVPSCAPETSSLVAMEALASGTPVVAFPVGALPEIVEHGRTGFLVSSVEEMAAALHEAGTLNGLDCRQAAEQRFNAKAMCARYLELYENLAATHPVRQPEASRANDRVLQEVAP